MYSPQEVAFIALFACLFGMVLCHFMPNLTQSRTEDFKRPMAERIEPDIEEIARYTRKWIL